VSRLAPILALVLLLAIPLAAGAQPSEARRVGLLTLTAPVLTPRLVAFRQALQELGYAEGKDVTIEFRSAEGRPDRLPTLAAELVRRKVDVIVTAGDPAIRAAKSATATIPIVMAVVGDPVAAGFVASLARPGGNLTGSTNLAAGLAQKRLELVREAAPQASRIAVLRYPVSRLDSLYWRETQQAAEVLGVTLNPVEVRDARELAGAFAAMTRARVGALVVFPDSFFFEHQVRIAELALKHEIPAIHDAREGQQVPGRHVWPPLLFFSLLLFVPWVGDSSEEYKALGLTIPPSVLAPADEVIE
jgi:ABC-type uncharacterized transport system substrate-binding protein